MNLYRQKLKGFYKKLREKDRGVGLYLNELMQTLHDQTKLPDKKRDTILIQETFDQISEVRKEKTFRQDFPSFAKFKEYVKEEGLTIKELEDMTK